MTTPSSTTSVLVSPEQLSAMMAAEPVVIIDTRDADTYAAGHLPGVLPASTWARAMSCTRSVTWPSWRKA